MTIARGQMNRQLYADGGVKTLMDLLEPSTRRMVERKKAERKMSREDEEIMEMLMEKQKGPNYQYDEKNMYEGPRDMRMGGGVMSLRQPYFLGGVADFVGDLVSGAGDVLGGVADAGKSLLKNIDLEDAAAAAALYMGVPPQFVSAGYGAAGGDNPLIQTGLNFAGGFQGGPGTSPFNMGFPSQGTGQGIPSLGLPTVDTGDLNSIILNEQIYRTGGIGGGGIGGGKTQKGGEQKTPSTANIIGKVLQGGLSLYGAKKSYDDQKRINEQKQREYDDYIRRRDEKRRQYQTGEGLPSLDVRNRTTAAAGGVIKGMKKLSKLGRTTGDQLENAFEEVSARADFDFSDYKMRGQLMAEELAEIRFKKDYYDLDQNTQMDLYSEASDFLNDKAADFDDMIYDRMKERDFKEAGGVMSLDVRTNPQGTKEIDYREKGGFVPPIGIKEKADDIPAMLSNNEFVFTADAVRGAGNGDVNKGAKKMYALMAELEEGGRV